MSSGYLRPYHVFDQAGVLVETQMLTDVQAEAAGLLNGGPAPAVAATPEPTAVTAPRKRASRKRAASRNA